MDTGAAGRVRREFERNVIAYEELRAACPECQEIAEWQVCSRCETRRRTRCPGCDAPLPPLGSAHCGHCGILLPR
ncbi:MAG TPA: hypothetical protein VFC53_13095 [Dehalococcoidia bacterium]|jgi:hypothetical protein|nr:hypothetical protein [Dehalococcoidia bacterium]